MFSLAGDTQAASQTEESHPVCKAAFLFLGRLCGPNDVAGVTAPASTTLQAGFADSSPRAGWQASLFCTDETMTSEQQLQQLLSGPGDQRRPLLAQRYRGQFPNETAAQIVARVNTRDRELNQEQAAQAEARKPQAAPAKDTLGKAADLLTWIKQQPGPVTMKEATEHFGVSQQALHRQMTKLLQRGVIGSEFIPAKTVYKLR
jgi:hypothetical protein